MQTTEHSIGDTAAIEADLTALARLAADLRRLAGELGGSVPGPALSDPELVAAIDRAEHDWRRHRDRLGGFLQDASGAVASAAAAYRQTDEALAAAARPR